MVVQYLVRNGYAIDSVANTATKEHGKDIVAARDGQSLWVTVKGFPVERPDKRTHSSTQAGHWFKHALYDAIAYRQVTGDGQVAVALPDFKRYRDLAASVEWVSKIGRFDYYWVKPDGTVTVTR